MTHILAITLRMVGIIAGVVLAVDCLQDARSGEAALWLALAAIGGSK